MSRKLIHIRRFRFSDFELEILDEITRKGKNPSSFVRAAIQDKAIKEKLVKTRLPF